jgi:hypothetical protein
MNMWNDAVAGKIKVQLRDNRDVENLLQNHYYTNAAVMLSLMATMLRYPPLTWIRRVFLGVGKRLRRARLIQ